MYMFVFIPTRAVFGHIFIVLTFAFLLLIIKYFPILFQFNFHNELELLWHRQYFFQAITFSVFLHASDHQTQFEMIMFSCK